METVRVRVVIGGRVQGVWFRRSTMDEAVELGLAGWVRNLPDGGVEAVFEGRPEAVAKMVSWVERGPERALVTSVEGHEETPEGLDGFEVR